MQTLGCNLLPVVVLMTITIGFLSWMLCTCVIFSARGVELDENHTRQMKLSAAINATLYADGSPVTSLVSPFKKSEYSEVLDVCNIPLQSDLFLRTGCCTPSDVKHLTNVLVSDGKFVLFTDKTMSSPKLPVVTSVKTQQKIHLAVPASYVQGEFSTYPQCKSYFEGTLHVVGRSTVKNVYHAIADNVLPLAAQVLLDAYLSPEFLHKPRMLLSDSKEEGVPHLNMMYKMMSRGIVSLKQADGMCFRRVVWGHGPHLFYLDTMIALRRKAADFIRHFAMQLYDIKLPSEFTRPPIEYKDRSSLMSSHNRKETRPLRVTVYSRGNSGKGRSMKGEDQLVSALQQRGALAVHLVDFGKLTLDEQLSYAIYSDVILGMHGAAFAHGLFMARGSLSIELKTLYAYESILFGLVADSRQGIHGQVDIRKYFVPGGHKPIDSALINRTIAAIEKGLELQLALFPEYHKLLNDPRPFNRTELSTRDIIVPVPSAWPGDFVFGPSSYPDPSTEHILGPLQSNQTQVCHGMLFAKVRIKLGIKAESFHCDICTTFVVR